MQLLPLASSLSKRDNRRPTSTLQGDWQQRHVAKLLAIQHCVTELCSPADSEKEQDVDGVWAPAQGEQR